MVDLPVLTGMAGGGEPRRGLRDRQPGELARGVPGPACSHRDAAASYGSESSAVRVGSSPGATTFPASISLASFAFSAARPGVSTPDSGCVGDRVAATAAEDQRTPDRDRRAYQRADDVHPVAVQSPLTSAGPNDRAGFIDVPLTGADHSPASAM